MDRVASFFSEKTPRRVVAIGIFVSLLYLFRHLAVLLVFFVAFERALGWASRTLAARTGWPKKYAVLGIVFAIASGLGLLAWFGIARTIRSFARVQATMPAWIAELRDNPLIARLEDQFGGTEAIVEAARHYAGDALGAASAVGHFVVHVVIGFILALVYVLEEDELATFWARVDPRSLQGTLGRWLGHVADATIVTVQLQLIVAAFNTLTTLPVLLVLGVPHVGPLMLLVFVSALVPVIGNVVAGVTLSLLAYQAKGWLGVGLFVGLTFVLHKVESYYLSPRLTSRHVKIPGFLLIVSLLACEQLFGFVGLFLSFPILFVAGRIRGEMAEEDAVAAGAPLDLAGPPDRLPARERAAAAPSGLEVEDDAD
jgi:putative heme transporter